MSIDVAPGLYSCNSDVRDTGSCIFALSSIPYFFVHEMHTSNKMAVTNLNVFIDTKIHKFAYKRKKGTHRAPFTHI